MSTSVCPTRPPRPQTPPTREAGAAGSIRHGPVPRTALVAGRGGVLLALGVAALFTVWATTIDDNPMVRVGQVSGLAALQFRVALCALPLLTVVGWALVRASRPVRLLVTRLGAAAAVGLVGGFLAAACVHPQARHGAWPDGSPTTAG